MALSEQVDAELSAFAQRMAEEFNNRLGPWKVYTLNSIRYYHVKGDNNALLTLESGDKLIGDQQGLVIIAKFLGGDETDWDNEAIWDKSVIG